jgi:hypothetical protein
MGPYDTILKVKQRNFRVCNTRVKQYTLMGENRRHLGKYLYSARKVQLMNVKGNVCICNQFTDEEISERKNIIFNISMTVMNETLTIRMRRDPRHIIHAYNGH